MSTLATAALCLVVGVMDGDTIKIRCGEAEQERIRLAEIDAPEKSQAFGKQSKKALSDLIAGAMISINRRGNDRYGRTLGAVYLDGVDVNRQMVKQGMAWCYKKYLTDQTCLADEKSARELRRGLWVDPAPIAPWEWRKR